MTSLTKLSLANRLLVGLITLAIGVFGAIAAFSLRQELLPSTQIPTAIVTATYPGTSPEIVAKNVASPLEDALSGVKGVTKVKSVSANGIANLTVEWNYGLDNDATVTAIRNAADSVQSELPDQTKINIQAGSTDDIPVLVVSVASDTQLAPLARLVNDVAIPKLSKIDGVRQVQLSGENTSELDVTLRPAALRKHDLTAAVVTQVIQAQALVVPAGTSYEKNTELAIQVGHSPDSAAQVASWPVPTADGPVNLGELASVKLASVAATTIARAEGRPALSLTVLKDSDADAVKISKAVGALTPQLQQTMGHHTTFSTVFDQAPLIQQSIHDLAVEGGLGLVFAVLVILVFLFSVRSTVITAISIPLSLLIALIGLKLGNYSLNIFTLAALTVAVGRVVDDSIVVTENIKRRDTGVAPLAPRDIVASVKEVAGAVTASTLTTVAVFLPVAIVSGVTGELFRPFSITIAIALVASLLVSMTIVPVLAYWFLRSGTRRRASARAAQPGAVAAAPLAAAAAAYRGRGHQERRVTRLQRGYLPVLGFALRRPVIVLVAAAVIFAGTMASATFLKTDFLGSVANKDSLQITETLPAGTRLSATSAAAKKIEQLLATTPNVTGYLTTVGTGGSNNATITATVGNQDAWDALRSELEGRLSEMPDVGKTTVTAVNTSGATSDVTVTVTGDDAPGLRTTSQRVQQVLESTSGLIDVKSDLAEQRPVLQVKVDLRKAAAAGFTSSEVGQAISNAVRGTKAGTVTLQGESRDIMVRTEASDASPKQIADLELPVSQLQQTTAQQKASDSLTKKQEAATQQATQEAADATGAQRQKLVEQRATTAAGLAKAEQQLARLQASPPPAPAGPPAGPGPAGPAPAGAAPAGAAPAGAGAIPTQLPKDLERQIRKQLGQLPSQPPTQLPSQPPTQLPSQLPTALPSQLPTVLPSATGGPQPTVPVPTQAVADAKVLARAVAAAARAVAAGQAAQAAAVARAQGVTAQLAAQIAYQQWAQQVGQATAAVQQAQAGITQLDAQVKGLDEQSAKSAKQSAQTKELAQEQKKLTDVRAHPITVADVATVTNVLAPSTETHIDGTRAVTVSGTPNASNLGALTKTVQSRIDSLQDVPAGITIEQGGASQDQQDAFRQLGLAMLLAIVLVFLIMVATFRSLVQPLILLISIPFAATGAVAALLVTNTALGVPAMVGLLMLIGIVVTNAIVLIDLINQYRAQGEDLRTAITDGARLRLRPIIMTACATIFALIPMGLGLTGGGAFISRPLAVVVIGGLVSSTILTLLLVPVLYSLVERRSERKRQRARREAGPEAYAV